jgi:hypothetical protein
MKGIITAIVASLLIAVPVFAVDENTVTIRESDGKIVYDASDGLNDRFMVHNDMTPGGEKYTDYLRVKNDTSKDYDVYFKITAENNTTRAENIIEHIEMKIYIDDVLYYDGTARGIPRPTEGIDLTDAVLLKNFAAGESVMMKVVTFLDAGYEDIDNPDTSRTHWHFYVSDEKEPDPDDPVKPDEVIPNPHTGDSFSPVFFGILFGSLALLIIVTIHERSDHHKRARRK